MADMSEQHRGTYQYWKPRRSWSYAKTARVAWAFSLSLVLLVSGFVAVATTIMLFNLPPETCYFVSGTSVLECK